MLTRSNGSVGTMIRHRGGYSSTEQRLIFLAAGTAAQRQLMSKRAEELSVTADWSLVTKLLRVARLLPLLGPRLIELSNGQAGPEFGSDVAQAVDAGRHHGVFLQMVADSVVAALAKVGVRSTTLKGPALSETLYGDPGRRTSTDIDLLVAHEQLGEAVDVVRGLGYAAPIAHVGARDLPLLHYALIHEHDQLPPVELHWRVHWYEDHFAGERLLTPRPDLSGAWRPAPIDEVAALLLFYARDGFTNLRLAADIGAWWDAFGVELQPRSLDDLIDVYPAFERVLGVAVRVAEQMVGLPADHLTERGRCLGARGRVALHLADPYPRSSEAQLYADMGLIDGLLAPPGTFRAFLRRQVILPPEVLRQRALSIPGQSDSMVGHGARVLARFGLAMTRLINVPGLTASDKGR
jgi:hypothetical protein